MKTNYSICFLFLLSFGMLTNSWGQTNFSITYTGLSGSTAAVASPTNLFTVALTNTTPYNGVDASCSTSSDGVTTYTTTITAKAGYNFTITSVNGTAYASSAGYKGYQVRISSSNANFATTSSSVACVGSSSSCAASATPAIGSLTGSFTTTAGNSCTISVLKSKCASETGGGYSKTKTLVISGTYTAVATGATKLALVSTPTTGTINTALNSFTVEARKADNSLDNTYTANITISKATGTGTLSGTVTKAAVAGVATFDDLKFNTAGTFTISAASGALTGATSGNIIISDVSATTDYFRSKQNGNWDSLSTWESSHNNSVWFNATLVPGATANTTTINHLVTATSDIIVTDVSVTGAGDTLKIAPTASITVPATKSVVVGSNAGLVFQSSSLGTARFANSVGDIIGNVTVERFIEGGRRAYRFLGNPFSGILSLSEFADDIDITGTAGVSGGFTNDVNTSPSAFYYNPSLGNGSTSSDPGWRPYTATNEGILPGEGLRLLVRGAKGQSGIFTSSPSYAVPDSVTISTTGLLNSTVDVSTSLTLGSNSGYNLISNPYISPINLKTVTASAGVNANYYIWNARLGTAGSYLTYTFGVGSPYTLPSSGAFFVNTTAASETVTFHESDKLTADTSTMLRQGIIKGLGILEMSINADNNLWDRLALYFNKKGSTSGTDKLFDGVKMRNSEVNLYSLNADQKALAVDMRPYDEDAIIPLGFTSNKQRNYTLRVDNIALDQDTYLFLTDKYLDIQIKIEQGTAYEFTVDGNAGSQGENRFELSQKPRPIRRNSFDIAVYPNPANAYVNVSFNNKKQAANTIKFVNANGIAVKTINAGNTQNGQLTIPVKGLAKGVYIVQLISGQEIKTSKLIIE